MAMRGMSKEMVFKKADGDGCRRTLLTGMQITWHQLTAGTVWVEILFSNTQDETRGVLTSNYLQGNNFLWGHACKKWQASDLMPLRLSYLPYSVAADQTSTSSALSSLHRKGEEEHKICAALWDWPGWMNDISLIVSGSRGRKKKMYLSTNQWCMFDFFVHTLEVRRLQ